MERLHPFKIVKNLTFILLILIATRCGKGKMTEIFDLTQGWQFRHNDSVSWHKATIPGTIHTDLFNEGMINDPYYGCNESELQWVGESDWVYRKSFFLGGNIKPTQNNHLVFEGLDTYATIYLNGYILGESSNMFRKWSFECGNKLKHGENVIEVRFKSALKQYLIDSTANEYIIPGGRWVYSRKAAYHFGWDWGPRFITCGITAPVYLERWENHLPKDLFLYSVEIQKEFATVTAQLDIESKVRQDATIIVKDKKENTVYLNKKITLDPSEKLHSVSFRIDNPILWWCNGLGDPHIYDIIFELKTDKGETWRKEIPFGVRKIEVVNEEDSIGQSFVFKLNNTPVYIKGANYIPQSSFITDVSYNDYKKIVETAVESNMNMVRVWGGGVYEKDIFYELCSRNGIMVWQDFMFACAMYPSNKEFLDNIRKECEYQVRRLRNYPSLAIWCGNNESDEAWHNWGWQKSYSINPGDSLKLWSGYIEIFHSIIPEIISKSDPGRFYLPSSPMYGWGREKSMTHTDSHYWGVWWGLQPSEMYLKKVPRFMSEFGLQSMPSLSTIRQFQPESADTLFSPQLKSHQKHPTGFESISTYLKYENLSPVNLISYIYLSQLVQAKGIALAIEAQRRSRPYCMGSLYWQLNDCWPVTSWSGMDSEHNWKALQYTVRNLYKDVIISLIIEDGRLNVHIISDKREKIKGVLNISLAGFENDEYDIFCNEITVEPGSSKAIYSEDVEKLTSICDPRSTLILSKFTTNTGEEFVNSKFMVPYGSLKTKPSSIEKEVSFNKDEFVIKLKADVFTPFLYLFTRKGRTSFSDNFFHLRPGETKVIKCRSTLTLNQFNEELESYSLNKYLIP
jgi:beta-mannosidase